MSTVSVQLKRDSTVLDTMTVVDVALVGIVMMVDTPAAGTYTYWLNLTADSDHNLGKRTLVALVAKK